MVNFKIVGVARVDSGTVRVDVQLDALQWAKVKAKGRLGALYGIDVSNAAYRLAGVKALCPTVSDAAPAKGGIKSISLFCADDTWQAAPDNLLRPDFQARRDMPASAMPCEVIRVDFQARRRVA